MPMLWTERAASFSAPPREVFDPPEAVRSRSAEGLALRIDGVDGVGAGKGVELTPLAAGSLPAAVALWTAPAEPCTERVPPAAASACSD